MQSLGKSVQYRYAADKCERNERRHVAVSDYRAALASRSVVEAAVRAVIARH